MRNIRSLPPVLANQIAAGEVVERPASIVKELIENSIDAGAKHIEVRLEAGGLSLIQITDDGEGILKDELYLALSPHATSKIYSLEELENLQSLGFRGEALASIASVSRFVLKSRPHAQEEGYQIEMQGVLSEAKIQPIALSLGTKIEVRDLFFNTPARRKFLKSTGTELSHIDEILRKIALSHAEITLSVYHNQKLLWQVSPAVDAISEKKRWSTLVGSDFYTESLPLHVERPDFALEGFIIQPRFMKKTSKLQYLFLNGRPIRDKLILHAIKAAYRDVSYGDHQPAYVLFLELDPKQVDFNVHPAKSEVRFREGRLVHDAVFSELKKRLSGEPAQAGNNTFSVGHDAHMPGYRPAMSESASLAAARPEATYQSLAFKSEPLDLYSELIQIPAQESLNLSGDIKTPRFGRLISQLHGLFILTEHPEGLMIIDIHAAHERILYERLKAEYQTHGLPTQQLLLPQTVELSPMEWAIFKEHISLFTDLGLDIEEWVDQKVLIRAVPVLLQKADLKAFMQALLHDFDLLGASAQKDEHIDQILAEIACHSAIQAGQKLSPYEMQQLLQDMEHTPRIDYCNHGRPTSKLLTCTELDRLFLRGR